MKKDLPDNTVEDIAVVVALENEYVDGKAWKVYVLNLKSQDLQNVMVSSRGYGELNGEPVKTSTLRHFIGDVPAHQYAAIEPIDDRLFGLSNEYWLSYYVNGTIYDKKYIFLPESVVEGNFIKLPLINKPGVMIR